MTHHPTDALLAALARRGGLCAHPERWCSQCQRHLASEGGADRRQLCPSCSDSLGGRP